MDSEDVIQLLVAIAAFAAVLVAIFGPMFHRYLHKRSQIKRIRTTVSLYLDVLELKLEKALRDLDKSKRVSSKDSCFEEDNKINYDAIERQYLDASILNAGERETLGLFVTSFKASKNMVKPAHFRQFLGQVRGLTLRKAFPRLSTFEDKETELSGR